MDADTATRLAELEAELVRLRSACMEFGGHKPECGEWNGFDCDCGFAELQGLCGDCNGTGNKG